MAKINWKRVWSAFKAYCDEMEFTFHIGNAWLYCMDKIEGLVVDELRRGAKKAEARDACWLAAVEKVRAKYTRTRFVSVEAAVCDEIQRLATEGEKKEAT